jgi:hypothetical protein
VSKSLADRVRQKLAAGTLPRETPVMLWAGWGDRRALRSVRGADTSVPDRVRTGIQRKPFVSSTRWMSRILGCRASSAALAPATKRGNNGGDDSSRANLNRGPDATCRGTCRGSEAYGPR